VEAVTAEETRKVLIGEDPRQETRPKKRLVECRLDFLAFVFIAVSIIIIILMVLQEVGTVLET
jgi:hypothetical protein